MEDINVANNVEASLRVQDLDRKTPLRQHDNAWIRVPAQWLHKVISSISSIFSIHPVHILFVLLLIGFGVWLAISTSSGHVSLAPLIIEIITVVAWGIYARYRSLKKRQV